MPFSLLEVHQRFGGTCHLHFQSWRIIQARNQHESRWQAELCLFFDPEMEVTCSSKTFVDFQRTTWHYILEDRTLPLMYLSCCYQSRANP
jgi:Pyruvate/2-oxoacid:ferredoxin oxidoreductase delta subunit